MSPRERALSGVLSDALRFDLLDDKMAARARAALAIEPARRPLSAFNEQVLTHLQRFARAITPIEVRDGMNLTVAVHGQVSKALRQLVLCGMAARFEGAEYQATAAGRRYRPTTARHHEGMEIRLKA